MSEFLKASEMVPRENIRPLGPVSNFVVNQLPVVLEEIRSGTGSAGDFTSSVDQLVSGLGKDTVNDAVSDVRVRDLAGLDLKMLDTAIARVGGVVPLRLQQLVDVFAQKSGQPTGITYEEIILVNPPTDRRLFTSGDVGKTEESFYETHRIIEGHLDTAIAATHGSIAELNIDGVAAVDNVVGQLASTQEDLMMIISGTHTLGIQSKEHFAVFRYYLESHRTRGTKGPSGAFTAGIPTLELLLAGEQLPEEYRRYLKENNIYFPRKGRERLREARELIERRMTLTLVSQRLGNPSSLAEAINSLGDLMRRFRGEHYKTVRSQVPEALSGEVAGTDGEQDSGRFLRDRMQIRHKL